MFIDLVAGVNLPITITTLKKFMVWEMTVQGVVPRQAIVHAVDVFPDARVRDLNLAVHAVASAFEEPLFKNQDFIVWSQELYLCLASLTLDQYLLEEIELENPDCGDLAALWIVVDDNFFCDQGDL